MTLHFELRHRTTKIIHFDSGVLEIETPMLTRSTIEGARDFSSGRVHLGVLCLPHLPSFQAAFDDGGLTDIRWPGVFEMKTLRPTGSLSSLQLDMEMAFVDREDILNLIEDMMAFVFREIVGEEIKLPLRRMSYADAMARYGSDKPDTRFGLEIQDVSMIVKDTGFRVFSETVQNGGAVRGINVEGAGEKFARREIDELGELAVTYGSKGLLWLIVTDTGGRGGITKFFSDEELARLVSYMEAQPGDLLIFVADKPETCAEVLGRLRLFLGEKLNLIDEDLWDMLWVVDWPLFEYSEMEGRFMAAHHPFTAPLAEDLHLLSKDPQKVRAQAYDLVLNGTELGGGSIRIHRREIQEEMFAALGLTPAEAKERFGFFLDAFDYGTPPHGGIAFGFDRWIMLLAKKESIRDVMVTKTASAQDLMTGAPSAAIGEQLRDLHVRLTPEAEKRLQDVALSQEVR